MCVCANLCNYSTVPTESFLSLSLQLCAASTKGLSASGVTKICLLIFTD